MPRCTWVDCTEPAAHPQHDKGGQVWADLCDEHDTVLSLAVNTGNVPMILCSWVRAKGGAEKCAANL